MATYAVPYAAGVLKAAGITKKKSISSAELRTASEPTQIKLTADRTTLIADGQDLAYITIELLDAQGVKNPKSENEISFSVTGGTIIGVGNANPRSLESYQQPKRKAWQGRCLVVVKTNTSAGPVILTATSPGLSPASLSLTAK